MRVLEKRLRRLEVGLLQPAETEDSRHSLRPTAPATATARAARPSPRGPLPVRARDAGARREAESRVWVSFQRSEISLPIREHRRIGPAPVVRHLQPSSRPRA